MPVGGYYAPFDVVQWFKSWVDRPKEENDKDEYQHLEEVWQEDDFKQPPNVQAIQMSGYDVVMMVECDSFFTPEGVDAIRSVVEAARIS